MHLMPARLDPSPQLPCDRQIQIPEGRMSETTTKNAEIAKRELGRTMTVRDTRRGSIRLQRYSGDRYCVEIFAPLLGEWSHIQKYPNYRAAMRAFKTLLTSMTRRSS